MTYDTSVGQVDRPHRIVTPATFRAPDGRTMRSELEVTVADQAGRDLVPDR